MMMAKTIGEQKAEQWRDDILAELVGLAENAPGSPIERRRKALELVEHLQVVDRMLSHARPKPIVGEFSSMSEPSEAIAAFLRLRGKPATLDQILDGIFEEGYMGGDRANHQLSVKLAAINFLSGTGARYRKQPDRILKGDIRGLIGLAEWDASIFDGE